MYLYLVRADWVINKVARLAINLISCCFHVSVSPEWFRLSVSLELSCIMGKREFTKTKSNRERERERERISGTMKGKERKKWFG